MEGPAVAPPELPEDWWRWPASLPRRYGAYVTSVDPMRVRYPRLYNEWAPYTRSWPSAVCWGDWDLGGCDHPPFREEQIRQICVERRPYREVDAYAGLLAEIRTMGKTQWKGLRSEADIERYFRHLADLFDKIRTQGYRRRSQRTEDGEITIRIARDGSLLKCWKGTHRLAIARILRLRRVPVVVDLIHWNWALACVDRQGIPMAEAVREELARMASDDAAGGDSAPTGP